MKKFYRLFVALAVMAIGAVMPAKAAVVESTAETENGLQFQLTYDTETDAKSFALYGVDFSKAVDENGKLVLGPVTGVTFANYDGEEHSLTTDIETYAILAGWDVNDYRESLKELRLEAVTALPSLFLSQPFLDSHKFPTALEKLFIGKFIPAIPDNAFPYHENLATVEFEDGSALKTIGVNAFAGAAELKDKDTIWYSKLESIVLPDKVETIGEKAFCGHPNLKEFTLDKSIKTIGPNAFYQCSIETLTLNEVTDLVSSENSHFINCPIKHLIVNARQEDAGGGKVGYVATIPEYLFYGVSSEFDVQILPADEEYLTVVFEGSCFRESGLTAVEMPEKMIPSKYEGEYTQNIIVYQNAFNSVTNLKSLDFSHATAGSIEIGDEAFYKSSIKELKLSNTVSHIGAEAFRASKLEKFTLEPCVDPDNKPISTYIGPNAFSSTWDIDTVKIKGTIHGQFEKTGDVVENCLCASAFGGSTVKYIELPDNLELIGNDAFSGSELNSFKAGPNLKSLGTAVFEYCHVLEEVDLSASQLEELPNRTFAWCEKLATVKLPVTPMKKWRCYAFAYSGIREITVNVEELETEVFYSCDSLETVKFVHPAMKTIPDHTLAYLDKLKYVDFGNHVTKIEKNAIYCCPVFDSLVVSRNIEIIEPGAVNYYYFGGKSSLKSITFKSTAFKALDKAEDAPFKDLDVNLYIDEAVTDISAYLFSGMKIANSVEINDLMAFDENAFKDTEFAHIDWHYPTIAASPFKNCTIRLLSFTDCPVIADELFGSNHTIENIDLSGVREIGKRAFFDVGLQNDATFGVLTVPASVQKIDARAFYNNKFDAIHIEKGTSLSIGNLAFGVGTDSYYSHIICDYPSDNIPSITASAFKTVHSERDVDVLSVGNCADVEAYQAATGWKSIRAKKWDGVSEYKIDFELVGTVFDHLKSDLLEEVTIDGKPASLATVGCNNEPRIQFTPKCSDIVFDHWPDGSHYASYYPELTSDTVIRIYVTELATDVKLQLSDPSLASVVKLEAKRHEDSEFTEMSEFKINNCSSGSYDILVELLDPEHYTFEHWIDPTPSMINSYAVQGVKGGTYTAVVERKEYYIQVLNAEEDKDKVADLLINGISKGNTGGYEIYPYGTEVTIEFKGNNTESLHYVVNEWGEVWSDYPLILKYKEDEGNKLTFTVEDHVTVFPVLREAQQFTVTARPSEWTLGTAEVTPVDDAAVQGKAAKFWEGSTVQLEAKPLGEHFHFERWNDGNTEPTRTLLVTEDRDLIAFFVRDSIDLALSVEGIDPELVTLSGAHRYGWGNDVIFSAEYTGDDYTFLGWYKDDELFCNETSCSILAETDLSLVARYKEKTPTGIDQIVNSKSSNRKLIIDGVLYIEHDGKILDATGRLVKIEK